MKIAQVVLLALITAGMAAAQEQPAASLRPDALYVSAEGKHEADPDTALVQFNVATQEGNAKKAYERVAAATEQVRGILRNAKVDLKAAEIGFLSVHPVYEWRPRQRVVGYRATANVAVRLKDFDQVAPIVEQFGAITGVGHHSVNYILQDEDEAKNRAVADAFRRARARAAIVAEASGRTLGELSSASIDTMGPIRPMDHRMRAESLAMAAGAPDAAPTEEFTPQRITVTARVNAVFALR